MRTLTRSLVSTGLALCLFAFAIPLAGCSSVAASLSAQSEPTQTEPAPPKHPAPDYSLARLGAQAVLGEFEARMPSGAPTPYRLGSLVPSESPVSIETPLDSSKPLLEQIPLAESIDWPVLDAKKKPVGEITIEWNGSAWSHVSDSNVGDSPYRRALVTKKAKARVALAKALGGAPEATRAVRSTYGLWQLGRRGTREMGVLVSLPPLQTSTTPPLEGQAYGGPDLIKWIQAQ